MVEPELNMGIFSLIGEDPHCDHGLGSQYNFCLRPPSDL
jgi:hypothetical protein